MTEDRRPYRRGVGAVIFNQKGGVFTGRRRDTPDAWQLPQGGIDAGETPKAALFRELAEEIGTCKVRVIGEAPHWLSYDLPPDIADRIWKGRYRGQTQRWFALRFFGQDDDIDLNGPAPEFDAWRWSPLVELPRLIVPFKRQLYARLVSHFQEFSTPASELGDKQGHPVHTE